MKFFTREHLMATLAELGASATYDIYPDLASAYAAPERVYHTADHIEHCLAHFQHHREIAGQPAQIEIALWFHDAIYDTRRADNEQRSADWARNFLGRARVEPACIERIGALIIATRHNAAVDDPDQQLLIDIDLGILGQSSAAFAVHDAAIRREYAWVPWPRYVEARVAVLTGFLNRSSIYSTPRFVARCEAQARRNIAHAIAKLERGEQ
jgi:predicted metal-dependent HD superfamily phosphohydrolase